MIIDAALVAAVCLRTQSVHSQVQTQQSTYLMRIMIHSMHETEKENAKVEHRPSQMLGTRLGTNEIHQVWGGLGKNCPSTTASH
jgi:hypothetical protein